MRANPGYPRHDAHGLFERPGDAEDHLARTQRGALGQDRNPGKHQLGIDRRREPQRGPHAGAAQQTHQEIDEPSLPAENVEQGHRAVRTIFVPSSIP